MLATREIRVKRPSRWSRFKYDFGDDWPPHGQIEGLDVRPVDGVRYPTCIAGARACPPEDCGGTPGYENLLAILADPEHEEHGQMMTWVRSMVRGKYDAGAFDVLKANQALARIKRPASGSRPRPGAQ